MAEKRSKAKTPPRKPRRGATSAEEPAPLGGQPTSSEVRKARKAELVTWAKDLGLDSQGKVDDLRSRILEELKRRKEKEVKPEGEREAEKPAAKGRPAKEDRRKGKEEPEEEEEEEYIVRRKPERSAALLRALEIRRSLASRRPRFLAQEWFRHKRLGLRWRKPQGGQSKLRRHMIQRINVVSIGFRSPKMARGLHPSGFEEVLVHSIRDLRGIDPKRQAIRIGRGVGDRKREMIQKEADELGLRVLNRREE